MLQMYIEYDKKINVLPRSKFCFYFFHFFIYLRIYIFWGARVQIYSSFFFIFHLSESLSHPPPTSKNTFLSKWGRLSQFAEYVLTQWQTAYKNKQQHFQKIQWNVFSIRKTSVKLEKNQYLNKSKISKHNKYTVTKRCSERNSCFKTYQNP